MRITVKRDPVDVELAVPVTIPSTRMTMGAEVLHVVYERGFGYFVVIDDSDLVIRLAHGGPQIAKDDLLLMLDEIRDHEATIDLPVVLHRSEDILHEES